LHAVIGGLAGVTDDTQRLDTATVSPRWAAAGIHDVRVIVHYAVSQAYLAYRLRVDEAKRQLYLTCAGSGTQARIELLLPAGWTPLSAHADSVPVEVNIQNKADSCYVCFSVPTANAATVIVQCQLG